MGQLQVLMGSWVRTNDTMSRAREFGALGHKLLAFASGVPQIFNSGLASRLGVTVPVNN